MSLALTAAEQELARRSFGNAMRLAVAGRYFDAIRSAHAVARLHPISGGECIALVEAMCGPALEHLGEQGTFEFSAADMFFHGKLKRRDMLVTYEAETADALPSAFRRAVEDTQANA